MGSPVGFPVSFSASFFLRSAAGTWTNPTPVDAAVLSTSDHGFNMSAQVLHNHLFISYKSAQNRLHVWDGTTLRRTGLAQPAIPSAANSGGAGSLSGTRYYRVRYIESGAAVNGKPTYRRSEPSTTLTFAPSGTNASITVTKPAGISEGETHWELEASTDNANFYILATVVVGTTTYVDSTAYGVGYGGGVLSEQIGLYTLQPSAKFIIADEDRLILAGHWTDLSQQSHVFWTPVWNDPGAGNDERLPLQSFFNNQVSLDNYDGGPITGLSQAIDGVFYVFKWSGVYRFARTGILTHAYDIQCLSKTRGAIPGSIVNGLDENGDPAVYFLDPYIGPTRIGRTGLQSITGLRSVWRRANVYAPYIAARGIYYPYKHQVHWWIAVDGAYYPNLKLVLQVNDLRATPGGVGGGWSLATGPIASIAAVTLVTEVGVGQPSANARPYIGTLTGNVGVLSGQLMRCDVGVTDAGTAYTAALTTRAHLPGGIMGRFGTMSAAIEGEANYLSYPTVSIVRDYEAEVITGTISNGFVPTGSETRVIRVLDQLAVSGAKALQIRISD